METSRPVTGCNPGLGGRIDIERGGRVGQRVVGQIAERGLMGLYDPQHAVTSQPPLLC